MAYMPGREIGAAERAPIRDSADHADSPDPLERVLLGGEPAYTRHEVAERAGVSLERAALLWRSLGFAAPEDSEVVFTDADVAALKLVAELYASGVTDATIELTLTRALSQAMARLTEWQIDILHNLEPPDSELRDAQDADRDRLAAAEVLVPVMEHLQQYVWRRHLLAASERRAARTQDGDTAPLAIGFADIVGFTSLSRGLDEDRLAAFLEAFEAMTAVVVAEHGGRVVKTVGDEVMFAADTARAAAGIGLELAERVSDIDGRPDLRVGIAYGPVLHRMGDAFGTVVNLASRLTALARPGSALVDRELAAMLRDEPDYRLRRLRRTTVRGFAHLQPWLLTRTRENPEPGADD